MHFSAVTAVVLATLATGTQAWQVTAYSNVGNCKANRDSTYRVISGATNNGACMTFGGSMPNTSCREYVNGGSSNRGCRGGFNARSAILEAGNCIVYDQPNSPWSVTTGVPSSPSHALVKRDLTKQDLVPAIL
ncbi:hypothetical protein FLONG3_3505 [Fusarium longipes]|uniref:Secreted LysM effector LysM C-terminal domain-containing protein n=1 Tax=Fusarium longipes TaxID=694270 RepID=A0A395T1U5_9HYPO|nr:hypothetical protein FLONG3_3505 [Fusarium longipes]